MKKNITIVSVILLVSLGITWVQAQYNVPANYATIQAAINAAPSSTIINVAAGTYTENVTVNKSLIINGVGPTTVITPSSGIGIIVLANNVTIQNLKVYHATSLGIWADGVSGLTITNVVADANGYGGTASGIGLRAITGTSILTSIIATNNTGHGLEIGSGSNGVQINGGVFTGNGTASTLTTGGGIIVYANNGTTTSGISIFGNINANTNTTAGIYIACDAGGTLNNTTIGATGTVSVQDNGSAGAYTGGAGVLVYGGATATTISTNFSRTTVVGAGLVALGTNNLGDNSPQNITVSNSTFTGYNNSTSPAITLASSTSSPDYISNKDIDALTRNTITGAKTSSAIEALIYHKVDNASLGLVSFTGVHVKVMVFLQGPYSGGMMSTALATAGLIPLGQPYTAAPFSYAGTETVGSTAFFTTNNVVDWILIELRSTPTGATVDRRAALLRNDGIIIDIDGTEGVLFNVASEGDYYIIMKHRNHLAIMSDIPLTLPNDASLFNFTVLQVQAYGTNSMAALTGGNFGLISGDASSDGQVNVDDRNATWNNKNLVGYRNDDVTLDGQVNVDDRNTTWNNKNLSTQLP